MDNVKPVQLFCVPHAGGTAGVFRDWHCQLPDDIEVIPLELTGRGTRSAESFLPTLRSAANDLVSTLRRHHNGGPYVLLGHGMGALVTFEMTRRLAALGVPGPALLVVSGRNPPDHRNEWESRLAPLPDDELFAALKAAGGVPPGLSPAMAAEFLPVIRADHGLMRRYVAGGVDPRVQAPILVLAGAADPMTALDLLPAWGDYTDGSCAIEVLGGDHYFVYDRVRLVGVLIRSHLAVPASAG